jgi:hypothetical protein
VCSHGQVGEYINPPNPFCKEGLVHKTVSSRGLILTLTFKMREKLAQ